MRAQILSPARILIVDDHSMVREGLRLRISAFSYLEVCGEATSEDEAMLRVKQTNPHLVIVDTSFMDRHGIELIKRVKSSYTNIKMLVSSGFQKSRYAERSLRAGALGYLNRQDSGEEVIEAIRNVLRDERYVSSEITRRLVSQSLGTKNESNDPIDLLSDRESEISRMMNIGQSSGAIANDLMLSSHAIDRHRENIQRRLGLKNTAELSRQAVQFLLENS